MCPPDANVLGAGPDRSLLVDRIDLYFATLCSWIYHPGYQRVDTQTPTLEAIADMVDAMIKLRESRWP